MKIIWQIRHIGKNIVQVNRCDENYESIFSTKTDTQICYIIGIGWNDTYMASRGTRSSAKNSEIVILAAKNAIDALAKKSGDEIIEYRYIYAHCKYDALQAYKYAIQAYF